jgi:hypothetical protein
VKKLASGSKQANSQSNTKNVTAEHSKAQALENNEEYYQWKGKCNGTDGTITLNGRGKAKFPYQKNTSRSV